MPGAKIRLFRIKYESLIQTKYTARQCIFYAEATMKKIICKKEYDTDTARLVKKKTSGNVGDSEGYEESLYVTDGGNYFLYVNGGEDSKYKKEDIKRMSGASAEAWLLENE